MNSSVSSRSAGSAASDPGGERGSGRSGSRLRCLTTSRRGDGRQGLLRLDLGGRSVALKFFGKKRSGGRERVREFGHWLYQRRSGCGAWDRWNTESAALKKWRAEGFDVPRCEVLENAPKGWDVPFLILEWIDGGSLCDLIELGDPSEAGVAMLQRFAQELGRRHARALELGDPVLLHQHPRLEHVMLDGQRMVTIDHELMSTRTDRMEEQVEDELEGWLRSILVSSESARAVRVFCDAYPEGARIRALAVRLERSFRRRAKGAWRRIRRRPARPSLVAALSKWRGESE